MNWTDEQKAVIAHNEGHAKVKAVAGSGKSAVLVERIARLVSEGVPSSRIQSFMFNASASESFSKRLRARLGGLNSPIPVVRTFHALGKSLCQNLASRGLLHNHKLETRPWVEGKMAAAALEQTKGGRSVSREDQAQLLAFIGLVKSDLLAASDKRADAEEMSGAPFPDYVVDAFDVFEEIRHSAGVRFFGDLIYDPVQRIVEDEDILRRIGGKFDFIQVDEYQDTNSVQQCLLHAIAGDTASVMVVGDTDQAIYEWRGAEPILMQCLFDADFPDPTVYNLSRTFRYGHQVSLLSNHVISHNPDPGRVLCLSDTTAYPTKVTAVSYEDETGAVEVADSVKSWLGEGRKASECAVLLRLYSLSTSIELEFLKSRLPYRLEGASPVTHRPEFAMAKGYLLAAAGRQLGVYAASMLAVPACGLQESSIAGLANQFDQSMNPGAALANIAQKMSATLPRWAIGRVTRRAGLMQKVGSMGPDSLASDILEEIQPGLGLAGISHDSANSGGSAGEVLQALANFTVGMTVSEALDVLSELEGRADKADGAQDGVLITSIHRAKGMEWPLVVIPGLKEGVFPAKDAISNQRMLESERRLFYVASTRAQEKLVLVHPVDISLEQNISGGAQGATGVQPLASRFLYESNIGVCAQYPAGNTLPPGNLVEGINLGIVMQYASLTGQQVAFQEMKPRKIQVEQLSGPGAGCRAEKGMRVRSPEYGTGRVDLVYPIRNSTGIRVVFNTGVRVLIAEKDVLYNEAAI